MALLTKEQIQSADGLARELVACPEWGEGGEVYVCEVTAREQDAFEHSVVTDGKVRNLQNVRARLAILTVKDAERKPLFTPTDAEWLGTKGARPLTAIMSVAMRLNGMRAEDLEELAGNSSGSQGGDSPSV
jgi:hypothetical protein